jgi:hypothetical protein
MILPRLRTFFPVAAITIVPTALGAETSTFAATAEECPVSDVEYRVLSSVAVRNTLFGAANGVYPLGAGLLTLRFDKDDVHLMSYEISNHLSVKASVALLSMTVVTTSHTTTASDACSGSAHGTLHNGVLEWVSGVAGYHSDGSQECTGSMCGKFGAPPSAATPYHDTPVALRFNPFHLSDDRSTFTMDYVLVSKSNSPRQTTYMALSGRRVRQTCAPSAPCGHPHAQ